MRDGTAYCTDFSLDDLQKQPLQLLLSDINGFPPSIKNIAVPRGTMVKLIEVALKELSKPKFIL